MNPAQNTHTVSAEDYIRQNGEETDWDEIPNDVNGLSEEFMTEFQDILDWGWVSCIQKNLTEDMIRKFQDKVNWDWVSTDRMLSDDFIQEFRQCMSRDIAFPSDHCNIS